MQKQQISCLFIIVCLAAVADLGIVYSTLPFFVKRMGGTASTYAWMFALYTIMQMAGNLGRGFLADRIGRRPVLLIGHFGSAAAMGLLCFSRSLFWIFVARGLSGLLNGSQVTAAAAVVDTAPSGQSIKGISMIEGAGNLGWFVLGTLLGGALYSVDPLAPFITATLFSVFNFIYTYFFFKETRPKTSPVSMNHKQALNPLGQSRLEVIRSLWSQKNISTCLILMGIVGVATGTLQSCYALFLSARFELDPFSISCLMALSGGLICVTQLLLVAPLVKRFGEYRLFFVSTIFCAFGAGIFGPGLMLYPHIPLLFVGILFWAIGGGSLAPTLANIISVEAPKHLKGTALGMQRSILYLAKGFSPVGGFLFDRVGIATPFVLTMSMFLLAGFLTGSMNSRNLRKSSVEPHLTDEPTRDAS